MVTEHIYRLEVGMVVRAPSSGGVCIYILKGGMVVGDLVAVAVYTH